MSNPLDSNNHIRRQQPRLNINATSLVLFAVAAIFASSVHALCAAAPEEGRWQNINGTFPYRVEVEGACNCEVPGACPKPFNVTVWTLSNGAPYNYGTYKGEYRKDANGQTWIYIEYGTGGYFYHQWMRRYTFNGVNYLRVWIYEESLDSKPSASEDFWFSRM